MFAFFTMLLCLDMISCLKLALSCADNFWFMLAMGSAFLDLITIMGIAICFALEYSDND